MNFMSNNTNQFTTNAYIKLNGKGKKKKKKKKRSATRFRFG